MTDLEKLLSEIEEEATHKVNLVLEETKQQIKEIELQGENERAHIRVQALGALAKEKEMMLKRAESAAGLQEKKIMLSAKYEIVEELLQKANRALKALKPEEYFKAINQLVKKYAKQEEGTILFTSNDYDTLPKAMKKQLEALSLVIKKSEKNFEGGFILKYGDVEENCSFDALFLEKKELLQDEVCRYLFE